MSDSDDILEDGPTADAAPALTVKLDQFEGPLDLLVHLVRKNEYDIFDIPIAEITDQYLRMIDVIRALNLDAAGEFLLMAATLMKIKSRMLLPVDGEAEEGEEEDPRALLAAQLAEYLRYKEAAEDLAAREQLDRDQFARKFAGEDRREAEQAGGALDVSLFDLIDAFSKLIAERKIALVHTVVAERVSVAQRIHELLDALKTRGPLRFVDLFAGDEARVDVIVTFLALLEVMRLSLARAYQSERFGPIHVALREPSAPRPDAGPADEAPPDAPPPAASADEPPADGDPPQEE